MGEDGSARRSLTEAHRATIAVAALLVVLIGGGAAAGGHTDAFARGGVVMLLCAAVGCSLAVQLVRASGLNEAGGIGARRLAGGLVAGTALLLALPAAGNAMAFFQRWWPSQPGLSATLRCDAVRWFALSAGIALCAPWLTPRVQRAALVAVAILATIGGIVALYRATGGNTLYRDDHPSFLFRMWCSARAVPMPVAWIPFWEAGHVDTSPAVTGAWWLGLVLRLTGNRIPPHAIYIPIVAASVILVPAAAAALGARLAGLRTAGCAAAAVLALDVSRSWFIWTLRFGTVPAGVSAAFYPLMLGLAAHVFRHPQPSVRHATAWAVVLMGVLQWPLACMMALPVALGLLISPSFWNRRRFAVFASGTALTAFALLPVAAAILIHADVGAFVGTPMTQELNVARILRGLRRLSAIVSQSHPLLITLGLAGAPLWPDRASRRVLWVTLGGLAMLSLWGDVVSDELQLTRAQLPLLLTAILPAAGLMELLLEATDRRATFVGAAAVGLLMLGAYDAVRQYGNRTNTPYAAMGEEPRAIADWIAQNVPVGARVMFAGPTVHAYGGGHIAYLPVLSGRSMLACDFYHFAPSRREYEYPPRAFRTDDQAVFEFLDLYNVAAILTYHQHWLKFFRQHPERFREVASFGREGRRIAFQVLRPPPGLFVQNEGEVHELVNGLDITLANPDAPAVLRYQWTEGLTADPPARLMPIEGPRGTRWIGIEPNGVPTVRIRWSPWSCFSRRWP